MLPLNVFCLIAPDTLWFFWVLVFPEVDCCFVDLGTVLGSDMESGKRGDICQNLVPSDFRVQEVYLIPVGTRCIYGFGSGSSSKI